MDLMTIKGTAEQDIIMRDALCANGGYPDMIADPNDPSGQAIPNTESKEVFAKKQLNIFLKESFKQYRADAAVAARLQAISDAEAEYEGVTVD